jgi:hypothetical protein
MSEQFDQHLTPETTALSRRTFVSGSLAAVGAGVVGGVLPGVAHAADTLAISAEGITLVAEANGTIVVQDGDGVERLRLGHFMVKDTVLDQQRTFGGTPSLITLDDGRPALRVDYRFFVRPFFAAFWT